MPPWIIYAGIFLSLVVLGLIAWWIRKRSRRPKPEQSARERALQELNRIRTEMETSTPYQFSIRVSDILRRYVTDQYQLPVTRQTSVEFLSMLAKASPFSEDEKSLLEDFLNRCDLIKVARYTRGRSRKPPPLEKATRFLRRRKT